MPKLQISEGLYVLYSSELGWKRVVGRAEAYWPNLSFMEDDEITQPRSVPAETKEESLSGLFHILIDQRVSVKTQVGVRGPFSRCPLPPPSPPQHLSLYAYELSAHWETCTLLFEAPSDTFKALHPLWRSPRRFPPPYDIFIQMKNLTMLMHIHYTMAAGIP